MALRKFLPTEEKVPVELRESVAKVGWSSALGCL